jgi:hypothetical protein
MRVIPALKAVAEQARKHAEYDTDLREALEILDAAQEMERIDREARLAVQGVDCYECGRRFLPDLGDRLFCSIGCRIGGKESS